MRLLVVALTSMTLVALELVWTRLFSAEFFYTFAFLALSLAILGLGLGALTLRLIPALDRESNLPCMLIIAAVTATAGPLLAFRLGLDFSLLFSNAAMVGRFVALLILLGAPFFFGGMGLALVFKHHSADMPRLYMADLTGAGIGVGAAIVAMNVLGTPIATVWIGLPVLLAAFAVGSGRQRFAAVLLVVACSVLSGQADRLLEMKRQERAPVIYRHWDAMAKIKMFAMAPDYRGINIDNVANTPVIRYDPAAADTASEPIQWDIDVGYLIHQFENCTFLSLGAGGGMDVLQAIDKGAAEIHAVEVIPHINRMMLEGDPRGYLVRDSSTTDSTGRIVTCDAFSGRLYHDPRVKVVTEDARSYVRRHPRKFDVIYSLSSNTWAALGSGAFALAENYLFTTEAFRDYWNALTDDGFLSLEHQMYMPRLVTEALDALRSLGVESPERHIAVYALPKLRRNLLLLSKRPLSDEIRYRAYGELTPERADFIYPMFPAPDSVRGNLIDQIASGGWRSVADTARFDISPTTDDRPFIAQLGLWRNLTRDRLADMNLYGEFRGLPVSKLIVAIILIVIGVLMVPLMLAPYAISPEKLPLAGWLYFMLIGMAFMAVEVVLIQKYALFLGASSHSLATVLLTLLIAAGIGSRWSPRIAPRVAFTGILIWLLLEAFAFRALTGVLAALPLPGRIATSVLLIAPLGFFMGIPFPKGVERVGALVDWGFAVNGVGSVLGATGVVLCAFTFGFRASLLAAALLYLAALALLRAEARWAVRRAGAPRPAESEFVAEHI